MIQSFGNPTDAKEESNQTLISQYHPSLPIDTGRRNPDGLPAVVVVVVLLLVSPPAPRSARSTAGIIVVSSSRSAPSTSRRAVIPHHLPSVSVTIAAFVTRAAPRADVDVLCFRARCYHWRYRRRADEERHRLRRRDHIWSFCRGNNDNFRRTARRRSADSFAAIHASRWQVFFFVFVAADFDKTHGSFQLRRRAGMCVMNCVLSEGVLDKGLRTRAAAGLTETVRTSKTGKKEEQHLREEPGGLFKVRDAGRVTARSS